MPVIFLYRVQVRDFTLHFCAVESCIYFCTRHSFFDFHFVLPFRSCGVKLVTRFVLQKLCRDLFYKNCYTIFFALLPGLGGCPAWAACPCPAGRLPIVGAGLPLLPGLLGGCPPACWGCPLWGLPLPGCPCCPAGGSFAAARLGLLGLGCPAAHCGRLGRLALPGGWAWAACCPASWGKARQAHCKGWGLCCPAWGLGFAARLCRGACWGV